MKNENIVLTKDYSGSIDIEDFKSSMKNFIASLDEGNYSKEHLEKLSKRSNALIEKIDMAINKKSEEQSFHF